MIRPVGNLVILPHSGSEVPEWFTFRNHFGDYDESKFDYIDDYGIRNYELPIEISWTENTNLVLCAVWEITESFVSVGVRMKFQELGCLTKIWEFPVNVSGGEIGADAYFSS
ncbi:uncharacterized protein Pyn_34919 [Prunus yedoensis var. nudiflora]|uniref:Uncharacterized protein n=1 Tax=Prunus yedoensis var. nudiflora TaxID=2094558 RepID=A0A314Y9G2_PRUYE|nr:uncharacterized protein Pyn_34919 [Prunus yedoensis var. nudiflora]